MASQMLSEATFAPGSPALAGDSTSAATMTLRGTIVKSFILLLVAFVFGAVVSMGARGAAIGIVALVVPTVSLGVLALTQPDLFNYFVNRAGEFSSPGSSGHLRFVTPFWALADVLDETPLSLLIGGGAGASERLYTQLSYAYNINTPLKIVVEYGLPGLVAYMALFLAADRTPRQSALVMPAMMLFLFTGAYSQFAPILFPIRLITSIARLEPAAPKPASCRRPSPGRPPSRLSPRPRNG